MTRFFARCIVLLMLAGSASAAPLYFKCDTLGKYDDYVEAGALEADTPQELLKIGNLNKQSLSGTTGGKRFSALSGVWENVECEYDVRDIFCIVPALEEKNRSFTEVSRLGLKNRTGELCSFSTQEELDEIAKKLVDAMMGANDF